MGKLDAMSLDQHSEDKDVFVSLFIFSGCPSFIATVVNLSSSVPILTN